MTFTRHRRWMSSAPTHCEVCKRPLREYFVDGATLVGTWAIMCYAKDKGEGRNTDCYHRVGVGLGAGRGQRYDLQTLDLLEG